MLRHGPEGERADKFLGEAARQLTKGGDMQGEIAAYLLREALGALIKLGGEKPFDLKQSAQRVVTTSKLPEARGGSRAELERVIGELEQALGDPNEVRLEDAVRLISRRKPLRGVADLLDTFLKRLDEANRGLHGQISHERAVELYNRTVEVVGSLFGPLMPRLAGIDQLLAIDSPSEQDASRLLAQMGDDRHLLYFFEKVEGPGWMQALKGHSILLPPAEGGWPAGPYLQRLIDHYPDLLRGWLSDRTSENLNANQSYFLLRLATGLKVDVADLVADLAQDHLEIPQVAVVVENYLAALSDQGIREPGLRRLVIESLKGALGGDRRAGDLYLATRILEVGKRGLAADPETWLPIFVHRLRELSQDESTLRLRTIRPLSELDVDSRSRSGLELMCGAVREAADGASSAGMASDQIISCLDKLEEPLRGRLLAQWLHEREDVERASRLLPVWIAEEVRPSPEQLDLLRWVFERGSSSFSEDVRRALGPVPEAEAIAKLPADEVLPEPLRRAHNWLVAVPEAERGGWAAADRLLNERFGAAPDDGVLIRVGPVGFRGAESPIAVEELAGVEPDEAARRIGSWEEPPGRSFLDPSIEGLADALGEIIQKDPTAWLDADPRQIVGALVAPRYIASYLGALEKTVDDIGGARSGRIVAVIAEIQSRAEESRREGAEEADAWTYASHLGIRLIRAMAEHGQLADEAFELAWRTVVNAVEERVGGESEVEGDVLTRAINRPWSSALEAAFSLGGIGENVDQRLLALIEDCLRLPRPSGELARAIIATRLPWLRFIAPQWFADNEGLLLGAEAPEGLGDLTFATYLEWGRPTTELLGDQRARIAAALDGEKAEFALRHLIHGLFWELQDYAPADVCALLKDKPDRFSEAARALALALTEGDEDSSGPPPGPALALWREALDADLPVAAYAGWGFFAHASEIEDQDWLELTLRTAAKPSVNLSEPDEIAARAEAMPANARVLELVGRLLEADPRAWELEQIGAIGLRLLRSGFGSPSTRDELRERLLERGFNEAAGID